jgi:hypothetical protein
LVRDLTDHILANLPLALLVHISTLQQYDVTSAIGGHARERPEPPSANQSGIERTAAGADSSTGNEGRIGMAGEGRMRGLIGSFPCFRYKSTSWATVSVALSVRNSDRPFPAPARNFK